MSLAKVAIALSVAGIGLAVGGDGDRVEGAGRATAAGEWLHQTFQIGTMALAAATGAEPGEAGSDRVLWLNACSCQVGPGGSRVTRLTSARAHRLTS